MVTHVKEYREKKTQKISETASLQFFEMNIL